MQAVVYQKPYELAVKEVPEPVIEDSRDIVLQVTSTSMCGSDVHIYHGLLSGVPSGTILRHEFVGTVVEAGRNVKKWKEGDRLLVPFPIACGECEMCRSGLWSHCINANTNGEIGAVFGYGDTYGGIPGGQAEYVRVPFADVSPRAIPDDMSDDEAVLLTDVLSTAYWITDVTEVKDGDTVAVFGCGPVGLLTLECARLKGAELIIAVDRVLYRLALARKRDREIETLNFNEVDPGEAIQELTNGRGADVVIDAVGAEAEPTKLPVAALAVAQRAGVPPLPGFRPEDQPAVASVSAINWEIEAVRHGGTIGLAGVYGAKANGFPIGDLFTKGVTVKTGQALVQNYIDRLIEWTREGRLRPKDIITHHLPLEEALRGYEMFSRKENDCVKVVLRTPA